MARMLGLAVVLSQMNSGGPSYTPTLPGVVAGLAFPAAPRLGHSSVGPTLDPPDKALALPVDDPIRGRDVASYPCYRPNREL